jgi:radical SAM superfamily enzyme YgiQ (UPF0313 family)
MKIKNPQQHTSGNKKILLGLLPFWTPLIPPLGISCLKSFLQSRGYHVKTVDLNIIEPFADIHHHYFNRLKKYIPENRRGNYYNIVQDVLRVHLMAHLHNQDEDEYRTLIKTSIEKTFYHQVDPSVVLELEEPIREFYIHLEKYFIRLLEQEAPEVLGLSVFTGTLPASLFVFKLTKEKYPQVETVMGGGIFTNELHIDSPEFPYFLRSAPYIDKIIVGEGELLFEQWLKGQLPDEQRVYTLNDINGQTLPLDNPDMAQAPDFSDFDTRAYPYLASYNSRSCPYQCTFCTETVQWGKYRKKSAKQMVKELQKLYETYGTQLFLMGDSLLNPIITDLAGEFINAGPVLYWDGYLRADQPVCSKENTLLWRRGGFYRARLGLESGSPRVLELMGKKITPGHIKTAVSALAYAGIKTTTYWVIGYPGETEADFQQTLDLIEAMKNDIYEAECNIFLYYLTGQVWSDQWAKTHKAIPLYPENARDLFIVQSWLLDAAPTREETYRRMWRFVQHCRRLDIPNPYSIQDIYEADTRWQKLHKNAVPSQAYLRNSSNYIDECRFVKKYIPAEKTRQDNKNFQL